MVRVTILHGWFQEVLEEMPDDPVRLQMLLHHRDKQLDELAERFKEGDGFPWTKSIDIRQHLQDLRWFIDFFFV